MSKPLTIVACPTNETDLQRLGHSLENALVEGVLICASPATRGAHPNMERIDTESVYSSSLIRTAIDKIQSDYALFVLPGEELYWSDQALARLLQVARDSAAGLVYSDYREEVNGKCADHPLIDYQAGSIRDNFDFGGAFLIERAVARRALEIKGEDFKWGGLYDLRLRISELAPVVHLPEYLYNRVKTDVRASGEQIFDYVDPRKRDYQIEMEKIATGHLQRIGALLETPYRRVSDPGVSFEITASIVIPVRNRVRTIGDAIRSALAQETSFAFNVIVVDNHSTDGTAEAIGEIASRDPRVVVLIPEEKDLGIGGCWNKAVFSSECGRYCVQLDSDDIYSGTDVLERIVALFREGSFAMVIGSYQTVDFELKELPPGLVDHREWTPANGRNNALRINGLGAPRAFDVAILRTIGFPDVSYGEDYAVALRVSREFEIGRVYEPLYLARRWGGNSDSALPLATMNRYDHYKDWIRTNELKARQRLNQR